MHKAHIKKLCVYLSVILLLPSLGCGAYNFAKSKEASLNDPCSAILGETADMGDEYLDSLTFVGDSNTAHLVNFGVLRGGTETKQVWLPKGNTISLDTEITNKKVYCPRSERYMTIPEAAAFEKPEYLVISLGTNGIATLNESQFAYCYKKLVNSILAASPDTRIIIQSIYPVTSRFEGFSNEQVDTANRILVSLACELGVRYIDTSSVLKDESGALKEEFNSSHMDGYHINKTAAELILRYIRTHGYE